MMKKKTVTQSDNYLERKPLRNPAIAWSMDDNGMVTLDVENTGWVNRLAQKLFGRPKVTHVHLDETGSFVWPLLDGERDITALGVLVDERFGEAAHPLYERLAKYFQILDSYGFVTWKASE